MRGTVSHHFQPTAFLGPSPECTHNDVTSRLDGLLSLLHVLGAVACVSQEMEDRTIVPHVKGIAWKFRS